MASSNQNRRGRQQEVICPHCETMQMQPEGAISTNCRSCGTYFKLADGQRLRETPKGSGPTAAAAKPNLAREVVCAKCNTPNRVNDAAMSTQCMKCANYLDLRDQVIRGTSSERLHTYGELTFAHGCVFRGFSAEGARIDVLGRVASRLEATSEIVARDGCQLSGDLKAPTVTVQKGAVLSVEMITCRRLVVDGLVEVSGTVQAHEVQINKGGHLKTKHLRVIQVEVEPLGHLSGRVEILSPDMPQANWNSPSPAPAPAAE